MKVLYQRRLVLVQLIRITQRYWVVITDPEMSVSILTDALPLYWLHRIVGHYNDTEPIDHFAGWIISINVYILPGSHKYGNGNV